MKQEQPPKNAAVPAETFSGMGGMPLAEPRGNKRTAPPPNPGNVVTPETMARMQEQIADQFKASDVVGRDGKWESERNTFQQGADMAKIGAMGAFFTLGLKYPWLRKLPFWGNDKDKKDKNGTRG